METQKEGLVENLKALERRRGIEWCRRGFVGELNGKSDCGGMKVFCWHGQETNILGY